MKTTIPIPRVHRPENGRFLYNGFLEPDFSVRSERDVAALRTAIDMLNQYAKAASEPTTGYNGVGVKVSRGQDAIHVKPVEGSLDLLVVSEGIDGTQPLPVVVSTTRDGMRVTIGDTSYIIHTR